MPADMVLKNITNITKALPDCNNVSALATIGARFWKKVEWNEKGGWPAVHKALSKRASSGNSTDAISTCKPSAMPA
jgi:hypothetical protein